MKCFSYMGWHKASSWMGETLQPMAVTFILELKGRRLSADIEHVAFLPFWKVIFATISWKLRILSCKGGCVTFASGAKWSCPV